MIQEWNEVIDYLAAQEPVNESYDLAILAGNSLPYLVDQLIYRYKNEQVKQIMLVGGIGHATPFLKRNFQKIGFEMPDVSEVEMYLSYIEKKFGISAQEILIEQNSTNSGENAAFSLEQIKQRNIHPKKVLLLEDPILQRRIKATFEREWREIDTVFTNDVRIVPMVKAIKNEIFFENTRLNGLWNKEYFFSLVLGEIPRLRNDKEGYGPDGQNFIDKVIIPENVERAYRILVKKYMYRKIRAFGGT